MNHIQHFIQKLMDFLNSANRKCDVDAPRKIPALRMAVDPFGAVIDYFRYFILLGSIFALLLTVVSFIFQHPYLCLYADYRMAGACGQSITNYLIMEVLILFLLSCFCVRWAQIILKKEKISLRFLCVPKKADLKSLAIVLMLIFINMIAAVSGYILYKRVPNPNYQIELLFFAVVSIGFWMPFLTMKFYSIPAFVWLEEKCPPLRSIWQRNRGNLLRILISLALISFLAIYLLISFYAKMNLVEDKNIFYIGFMAEYLYNFFVLLIGAFFANHCLLQKTYLFGKEKDDCSTEN